MILMMVNFHKLGKKSSSSRGTILLTVKEAVRCVLHFDARIHSGKRPGKRIKNTSLKRAAPWLIPDYQVLKGSYMGCTQCLVKYIFMKQQVSLMHF